jgi:hypothetical protein
LLQGEAKARLLSSAFAPEASSCANGQQFAFAARVVSLCGLQGHSNPEARIAVLGEDLTIMEIGNGGNDT